VPLDATVRYSSAATGWGAKFGGLTTVADYLDVLTYSTANNQVTITGYTGTGGVVIIPASIGGAPVTAIGENTFLASIGLTSVTIPDSVTSIGGSAFAGCSNLVSLSIGSGITSIGDLAFLGCNGITRVMIPAAAVLGVEPFPPTTTILRYLTEAQLASRDSQQNAAGRALGQADVKNAPNTHDLYTAAQYAANYESGQAAGQATGRVLGQADVTSSPNTYSLYNLSQVQALNVGTPLLTRDAVSKKFKLTMKVKKSTDLKTFTSLPFVPADSTINSNGEMEFQFSSTDNAAFYRLESH
jgi:hypothetical protein